MSVQRHQLVLAPLELGGTNAYVGELLHGWIFALLGEHAPDQATVWHEAQVKPFSVSAKPLHEQAQGPRWSVTIHALTDEAVKTFQYILPPAEGVARLGSRTVRIVSHDTEETITYEELLHSATHGGIPATIRLSFRTPTTFRDHGVQTAFPTPDVVFGGLYRRWTEFSTVGFPERLEWGRLLGVSRFKLESEMTIFRQYKLVGCLGHVDYHILGRLPQDEVALICALAKFAEYAGVGYKPTMGMGRTTVVYRGIHV